ncbi:hypothetical protein ACLOJK_004276 [Asimina triloba]
MLFCGSCCARWIGWWPDLFACVGEEADGRRGQLAVAAGSLLAVDGLDVAGWIGLWPWASMGWAMVAGPMEKPDDGDAVGGKEGWMDGREMAAMIVLDWGG